MDVQSAVTSGFFADIRRQARQAPVTLIPFIVTTLVAASLSAQSNDSHRPLLEAITRGDTPAVLRLIASGTSPNAKDEEEVPVLMLATLFSDAACVELLLKNGADPNGADGSGATPLMWAVPDIAKVRVLIEHGAAVNARSRNLGRTPLLIAAGYPGTVHLLELLLARGADLHAKDAAGNSALALAMQGAGPGGAAFSGRQGPGPHG